jgi:hypothetical protein
MKDQCAGTQANPSRGSTCTGVPVLVSAGGDPSLRARLAAIDWQHHAAELDGQGWTVVSSLLTAAEADAVSSLYDRAAFRSHIVMGRYGFGQGDYKYFAYPLPDDVEALRAGIYPRLAPIANRWYRAMNIDGEFPPAHAAFIERCHSAGQRRPTPLMLDYGPSDYCCLHQDLYGEHVFPLQAVALLAQPGIDFTGGELMLTEQRPQMQSRATVVPLIKGDVVVFAVNDRPVRGTRGYYRVKMRHGVSKLHSGHRRTLGVIFHDAK